MATRASWSQRSALQRIFIRLSSSSVRHQVGSRETSYSTRTGGKFATLPSSSSPKQASSRKEGDGGKNSFHTSKHMGMVKSVEPTLSSRSGNKEAGDGSRTLDDPWSIRVLTYNVLSSVSSQPTYFPRAKAEHLKPKKRWACILDELKLHQADIVCLQEVDQYKEFWKPELQKLGYQALYQKRSGLKNDGEVVAFRYDKYYAEFWQGIEYNKLVKEQPDSKLKKKILTNNTSLAAMLIPLDQKEKDEVDMVDSPPNVLVASVHLCWQPEFESVRKLQAKHLLETMLQMRCNSQFMDAKVATILAGDFNTQPYSETFQTITEWRTQKDGFRLGPLCSAYGVPVSKTKDIKEKKSKKNQSKKNQGDVKKSGVAPYSSFKYGEQVQSRLVDYIFYGSDQLHVDEVLDLPDFEDLKKVYSAFPNEHYGSDHICLATTFISPFYQEKKSKSSLKA